jgi:stage II sporulation protein D
MLYPRNYTHVWLSVAIACLWALPLQSVRDWVPPRGNATGGEDGIDLALQSAADSALAGREGTIVVMDAQSGRLRAVVNPRRAYEEALPPGSTIKPFTALAALRAGSIDPASRLSCREPYRRGDFKINCSHPLPQPPFDLSEALAHSCNYFFSNVSEELDAEKFNATLAPFGFGERTGIGGDREAPGKLPRGAWQVRSALGEGDQVLVTPIQLITAYAALVNGGRLLVPRRAPPQDFTSRERATLDINPAHRALLLKGMRDAVTHGTAAHAGLDALPQFVFGKTGTSTPLDDFRSSDGWFVGFLSDAKRADENITPERVRLVVLVFLKDANGKESAALSRTIFEAYGRVVKERYGDMEIRRDEEKTNTPPSLGSAAPLIRVRLSRERETMMLPLDDYVFGVLAAEASTEDQYEALKAQAVVSRTFALKNLRRHARDGYDLCGSTHCQRYVTVRDENARAEFYESLRRALRETAGEELREREGRLADAYFSASCGGVTANLTSLWGIAAPSYLRGARDEHCAVMPHHSWTDTIPAAHLLKALQSDPRSDVGARLDHISVIKRDRTGRAETVALEGGRRRTLRGWDFKIIVGRTLGWSVLKSSRFEVTRAGNSFIFRGSGFGHGLGLCQMGAHVLAARGASYRQILGEYFPGTNVSRRDVTKQATTSRVKDYTEEYRSQDAGYQELNNMEDESSVTPASIRRDVMFQSTSFPRHTPRGSASPSRLALSSENFRAEYPANVAQREIEGVLRALEAARADVNRRLAEASLKFAATPKIELFIHDATASFVGATGQPTWVGGATRGRRIELQPLAVLARRRALTTTLRHEYAHVVIEALGGKHTPRWLAEGLAAHVAGEGAQLALSTPKAAMSLQELEGKLTRPASAQEMRALYAVAYREVSVLVREGGEASVWQRIARR